MVSSNNQNSAPVIGERDRALYAQLGIPLRFQDKGFNNYRADGPNQQKALATCRSYAHEFPDRLKDGVCLIMVGAPGTGKTHLAFSILRYVSTKAAVEGGEHYQAIYTTVMDLFKRVKSTYSRDASETERDAIRSFTEAHLLILDEVGVQHGSETELSIMFEVIDKRYQEMKPTIVVGNLSFSELCNYLGERVIDRMREGGGQAVIFDWESNRISRG